MGALYHGDPVVQRHLPYPPTLDVTNIVRPPTAMGCLKARASRSMVRVAAGA